MPKSLQKINELFKQTVKDFFKKLNPTIRDYGRRFITEYFCNSTTNFQVRFVFAVVFPDKLWPMLRQTRVSN
jgi:hypothetical protein